MRGVKRLRLLKFNGERWSSVVGAIVVAGHAPGRPRSPETDRFKKGESLWLVQFDDSQL